jgi:hypothetical protein
MMVIVKALLFTQAQLDDRFDHLILLDLTFTRPSAVAVNHALDSRLLHAGFDPVALPFADAQCPGGTSVVYSELAAIHSLNYV